MKKPFDSDKGSYQNVICKLFRGYCYSWRDLEIWDCKYAKIYKMFISVESILCSVYLIYIIEHLRCYWVTAWPTSYITRIVCSISKKDEYCRICWLDGIINCHICYWQEDLLFVLYLLWSFHSITQVSIKIEISRIVLYFLLFLFLNYYFIWILMVILPVVGSGGGWLEHWTILMVDLFAVYYFPIINNIFFITRHILREI